MVNPCYTGLLVKICLPLVMEKKNPAENVKKTHNCFKSYGNQTYQLKIDSCSIEKLLKVFGFSKNPNTGLPAYSATG